MKYSALILLSLPFLLFGDTTELVSKGTVRSDLFKTAWKQEDGFLLGKAMDTQHCNLILKSGDF